MGESGASPEKALTPHSSMAGGQQVSALPSPENPLWLLERDSWERGAQSCVLTQKFALAVSSSSGQLGPSHPQHQGHRQRRALSTGWINRMKTGSSHITICRTQLLFKIKIKCALTQNSAEGGQQAEPCFGHWEEKGVPHQHPPLWVLGRDGGTDGELGASSSTLTLPEQISISSWVSACQG